MDSLNILGFSLPGCGSGVTDPISTNPKPISFRPRTAFPSLSKPAAIPIGFENSLPKTVIFYKNIIQQKNMKKISI